MDFFLLPIMYIVNIIYTIIFTCYLNSYFCTYLYMHKQERINEKN